jgi:hypothetical protein
VQANNLLVAADQRAMLMLFIKPPNGLWACGGVAFVLSSVCCVKNFVGVGWL